MSEEDCSEYGVPFKEQPDKVVNDTKDTGDVVVDDKKDESLKENLNPSSAKARTDGIGRGMLTMAAFVYAWNMM